MRPVKRSLFISSLLVAIAPSIAFSLVGNRAEFFSGTSSTYETEPTATTTRTRIGILDNFARVSFSRINYRNGRDHEQASNNNSSNNGPILRRAQTSSNAVSDHNTDDTSKKVDEYLEFLDKRYNRVHHTEAPPAKKQFPVLNWLLHQEEKTVADDDENRSNAFYALDVAGLASERLLQKHGVSPRESSIVEPSSTTDSIVEVEHASDDEIVTTEMPSFLLNKIVAAFTAQWVLFQRQVTVRKHLLGRVVSRKTRALLKSALASIPTASANLLKSMWKFGGGTHSIKFVAAVLCLMLMHVAKPLAKGALSTGTHA